MHEFSSTIVNQAFMNDPFGNYTSIFFLKFLRGGIVFPFYMVMDLINILGKEITSTTDMGQLPISQLFFAY